MIIQNLQILKMMAAAKLNQLFSEEKGEVNIVATVVLIGIAVLLALTFKTQINDLLTDLFAVIKGTAKNAVTGP